MTRPKIFIATPSHDHKFHAGYVYSLLRLVATQRYELRISKVGGAGVARARNNMAEEFLAARTAAGEPYDYYFAIDADITFEPDHVARILAHDLPIVCGLYSLKQHNVAWCINTLADSIPDDEAGRQKVAASGTGFMCIKREVFERMILAYPEIAYTDDLEEARGRVRWDFFSMGVHKGRYLSEDWFFCHRARELGYDVWVDTTFHLMHEGIIGFPINPVTMDQPEDPFAEDLDQPLANTTAR